MPDVWVDEFLVLFAAVPIFVFLIYFALWEN